MEFLFNILAEFFTETVGLLLKKFFPESFKILKNFFIVIMVIALLLFIFITASDLISQAKFSS
tara:strand:- start:43 stop:231 length:189 start_codon:yes stop_codon:yes gene_type:complete